MKNLISFCIILLLFAAPNFYAQVNGPDEKSERQMKSDRDQEAKAAEWVESLNLSDAKKIDRVEKVISDHLKAVRDFHNSHPYTEIPEGINPRTGDKLNELDRRMISHSAKPESIHENFMSGLKNDLSDEEVIAVLDKYTVGKVDFTMKGYHAIVPDLSDKEADHIRGLLEEARERAVDYKNMEEISAIFEIYKTEAENYLNSNGRNWRQLYKDYVNRDK